MLCSASRSSRTAAKIGRALPRHQRQHPGHRRQQAERVAAEQRSRERFCGAREGGGGGSGGGRGVAHGARRERARRGVRRTSYGTGVVVRRDEVRPAFCCHVARASRAARYPKAVRRAWPVRGAGACRWRCRVARAWVHACWRAGPCGVACAGAAAQRAEAGASASACCTSVARLAALWAARPPGPGLRGAAGCGCRGRAGARGA